MHLVEECKCLISLLGQCQIDQHTAVLLTLQLIEFLEIKDKMPKKDAIIETMNFAFPTIVTSGTMLALAGIFIGQMSSDGAVCGIGGAQEKYIFLLHSGEGEIHPDHALDHRDQQHWHTCRHKCEQQDYQHCQDGTLWRTRTPRCRSHSISCRVRSTAVC